MWWRSWGWWCFVVFESFFGGPFGGRRSRQKVIWMYYWFIFLEDVREQICWRKPLRHRVWAKVGRGVTTQSRVRFVASKQVSAFARHDGARKRSRRDRPTIVRSWRDVRSSTFGWWRSWRRAITLRGRTITARALCGVCWREAKISCGGSSRQSKGREGWHCLTCVFRVISSQSKIVSWLVSHKPRWWQQRAEETLHLVVRVVRRPVPLAGPEQSL